ncbi:GNAT family N-acetyltransferase [Candidatus Fukatsuia endosymbiont of Tuberolachnus salignus]|uniref:GNAT family N-acetyltransferase n=1 Tax=Candidatus Fukatsuia endosymbiont of Tuberolachnus salignus TaxID=3077957 RepID=UPI003CC7A1DD
MCQLSSCLRAELGYWLGSPFWRQGYATEATLAVLHFGFTQLSLNWIYASHLIHNPANFALPGAYIIQGVATKRQRLPAWCR